MTTRRSQVTTKRGDAGETTALSGDDLPKSHIIVECTGTIDELRAHTALLRLQILEREPNRNDGMADFLFWLLHTYFLIGTACSDPLDKHPEYRRDNIGPDHLARLEQEQARMEEALSLPSSFLVSASNSLAAQADVACTVARRLERNIVRLKEAFPAWQSADILRFVNRLSDTLFIVARRLDGGHHVPVDYGVLDRA